MVRAEPPTPRRPAAPGPVRHTQQPGAGRPPPTPPPAESAAAAAAAPGICPLAGPGQRDAELRRHLGADGAQCAGGGEGESGLRGGGRSAEARPGPAPSAGRTGVTTPRRVGRLPRARALETAPFPQALLAEAPP